MRSITFVLVGVAGVASVLAACGGSQVAPQPLPELPPRAASAPKVGVTESRCSSPPKGRIEGFRHHHNHLIAALGHPVHHGNDLIAASGEDQHITGHLAYTIAAKSVGDEDVELYACDGHEWSLVDRKTASGDGDFAFTLSGPNYVLSAGLRDLYARVPADGSGTAFLAFVASAGTPVIVTDVDGTLTTSENAFPKAIFLPVGVGAQPDAAAALARAPAQVIYLTARGEHFTNQTRRWLADNGFPRGPLRLAPGWFARPGEHALAAKNHVLDELKREFTLAAGIGNRASDITAYTAAGVPAVHIFVKLPEKEQELAPLLARGEAIGFASYAALDLANVVTTLPRSKPAPPTPPPPPPDTTAAAAAAAVTGVPAADRGSDDPPGGR